MPNPVSRFSIGAPTMDDPSGARMKLMNDLVPLMITKPNVGFPQMPTGSGSTKRRQYIQPGGGAGAFGPHTGGFAPPAAPPSAGVCPSGDPSLPIECDPKRPWPQCPPQSYCYATNTVDIGPYFCCPICK